MWQKIAFKPFVCVVGVMACLMPFLLKADDDILNLGIPTDPSNIFSSGQVSCPPNSICTPNPDGSINVRGEWENANIRFNYPPYVDVSEYQTFEITIGAFMDETTDLGSSLGPLPLSVQFYDTRWDCRSTNIYLPEETYSGNDTVVSIPMSEFEHEEPACSNPSAFDPNKFKNIIITINGTGHPEASFTIKGIRFKDKDEDEGDDEEYNPPPEDPAGMPTSKIPAEGSANLVTLNYLEIVIDGEPVLDAAIDSGSWLITSSTDTNYPAAAHPQDVGRFSATVNAYDTDFNGQDVNDVVLRHTFYLRLDQPLKNDNIYHIRFYDGVHELGPWEITAGYGKNGSRAIKINQLGYNFASSKRYAYIGYWMGTLGKLNMDLPVNYNIFNAQDRSLIVSGTTVFRGDDAQSGETVHEIDLSGLGQGTYYIEAEGIGRSHLFRIGGSAFDAFYTAVRGIYHQRCGSALEPEHTRWPHPICHKTVYRTDDINILENWGEDFPNDPEKGYPPPPQTNPIDVAGGWHDAGDHDRRPLHIETVEYLLILSEMFPDRLGDNILDIPESGNGVSDVLDEALYGLALWENLQEPSGGVRAGTQTFGHPPGNMSQNDTTWPYYVYSPNRWTSYRFAAAAIHAARLLEKYSSIPAAVSHVASLRAKAVMAWNWAESQHPNIGTTGPNNQSSEEDIKYARTWATGEFYAANLNSTCKAYGTQDVSTCFTEFENSFPSLSFNWDSAYIFWAMAIAGHADSRNNMKNWTLNVFERNEENIFRNARSTNYRLDWGNGTNTIKFTVTAMMAHYFFPDQRYIDAISINADYQLGAHPLAMSWITGLGYYQPPYPLHNNSTYDGITQPVPGLPVNGPFPNYFDECGTNFWKCLTYDFFYPSATNDPLTNLTPPMHHYAPWRGMSIMNEFTVWGDMSFTALGYGFLYAVSDESPNDIGQLQTTDYPLNAGYLNEGLPPDDQDDDDDDQDQEDVDDDNSDMAEGVVETKEPTGLSETDTVEDTESGATSESDTGSSVFAGGCSLVE